MNAREITYYDVSPYAAESAEASAVRVQSFSNLSRLFAEDMSYNSIQTCERNYTILDGTHKEFSKDESAAVALWSKTQSVFPSRLLSEYVILDISFGGYQSSPGITLYFEKQNNTWCDTLKIRWYKDNNIIDEKIFYPDSTVYACQNTVTLYNRIEIEFIRMNMPFRYLRLEAVLFGLVRVFGDGELENLTISEGFDPTGRTLYINSADFTFNAYSEMPYIFMKRQPLNIRYNGIYMGTYYIDKSKRYTDRRYLVEAIDKIGVLDASEDFMGGIYNNITAENLIALIVGGIFKAEISEELKGVNISGWLPIMKRRDALAQVAVAIGAMIDTSRTDFIKVTPILSVSGNSGNSEDEVRVIGDDRTYQSGSVGIEFPRTGISLTEHNFTVGDLIKELYKDNFIGEKTIRFSEPVSNLTVSNGVIVSSGANHAVIRSTGGVCELKGQPYIDNKSFLTIKNEESIEGTQEKIEKIENCYLVNKNNSRMVAEVLYEYYLRGNVFEGDFLLDLTEISRAERVGDIVKIASISGQIEKLVLRLGSKNIKARGMIRGG